MEYLAAAVPVQTVALSACRCFRRKATLAALGLRALSVAVAALGLLAQMLRPTSAVTVERGERRSSLGHQSFTVVAVVARLDRARRVQAVPVGVALVGWARLRVLRERQIRVVVAVVNRPLALVLLVVLVWSTSATRSRNKLLITLHNDSMMKGNDHGKEVPFLRGRARLFHVRQKCWGA
jgi:hypothetical protein